MMIDSRDDRHLMDTTNMLQRTTQHGTDHLGTNGTAVCPPGMVERILQENRQLLSSPIQGLVPSIGPLHISLNAQENVMKIFHPVFKWIYEKVFPRCKLADSPKPWRTSLTFEIVYGGWTKIRNTVLQRFDGSRPTHINMLLNLLDNYLPLVLTIHAVSFKLNKFKEYQNAVIRIWTMFLCFKRRHYNKSPLVWLSQILYWQQENPKLSHAVASNVAAIDEYRVENTHSIIGGNTTETDTPEQLSRKAKAVFTAKASMKNFKSSFTPPKNYTFSRSQLDHLKIQCSETLTEIFEMAANPEQCTNEIPSFLDNKIPVNTRMLPLGYQTVRKPSSKRACD